MSSLTRRMKFSLLNLFVLAATAIAVAVAFALFPSPALAETAKQQQDAAAPPVCDGNTTLALGSLATASTDEEYIAQGTSGTCTWIIDANGNLVVSPTEGDVGQLAYTSSSPWYSHASVIRSVSFTGTIKTGSCTNMFNGCTQLSHVNLANLDTSAVTSTENMFNYCSSLVTVDVSMLDTSSLSSMLGMFRFCSSLENVNFGTFDTSKVSNMKQLFWGCSSLKKVFVGSGWTTSAVTESESLFASCNSIVGANGTVYTEEHTDASYACVDTAETPGYLRPLSALDEDIASGECGTCTWVINNIGKLTISPKEGESGRLDPWKSSPPWAPYKDKITAIDVEKTVIAPTCLNMFYGCILLASANLAGLDTSQATNMAGMFQKCSQLSSFDASPLTTSSATNMSFMFDGCRSISSLDLHTFNTSRVESMGNMFSSCPALTSLNISGFDTSSVKDMSHMFSGCPAVATVDFSKLNTSKVASMKGMFELCSKLNEIDVSHLDTSNVTDMSFMFCNCTQLAKLDPSRFDTSKTTNMESMFANCGKLTALNLAKFDTSSVTNMQNAFNGCSTLRTVTVGDTWNLKPIANTTGMFTNCNALIGACGTAYAAEQVSDGTYARIDAADKPGYFWYINSASTNNGGNGETNPTPQQDVNTTNSNTTNNKASENTSGNTSRSISLAKAEIKLSKRTYPYNGKTRTPAVTVRLGGKTLKVNRDYTLSYAKGRKAVGTYKVTVTGKGSYTSKATTTFTIVPKTSRIKSVKAHKNSNGSFGFIVTWGKASGKKVGYTIRWSTSKSFGTCDSFTFASTSKYAKSAKAALRIRSKSLRGKRVYVQVQAFQKVGKTVYRSAWSAAKSVKLKK